MSNFPIENMVKLTYNIRGGDFMAEFCLDCWNKIHESKDSEKKYILSKDLELCEGCGEWKPIIMKRKTHYMYEFKYFILPFRIICRILCFVCRMLTLPFFIFKYYKSGNKEFK